MKRNCLIKDETNFSRHQNLFRNYPFQWNFHLTFNTSNRIALKSHISFSHVDVFRLGSIYVFSLQNHLPYSSTFSTSFTLYVSHLMNRDLNLQNEKLQGQTNIIFPFQKSCSKGIDLQKVLKKCYPFLVLFLHKDHQHHHVPHSLLPFEVKSSTRCINSENKLSISAPLQHCSPSPGTTVKLSRIMLPNVFKIPSPLFVYGKDEAGCLFNQTVP